MVPHSINHLLKPLTKNISAILFAGMFFFSAASATELAERLYQEENWNACLIECRRIEMEQSPAPLNIQWISAMCNVRLNTGSPEKLIQQLNPLASQSYDQEIAAKASFEMGRLFWETEEHQPALDAFVQSFQTTTNQALFLRSACSAFLVMNEAPSLKQKNPEIVQQINTSRILWTGKLFGESRLDIPKDSLGQALGKRVVNFYRTQISPAIGQRCTLEPSCSEYFKQTSHKHGLLGIPMTADRFIREPTVNNDQSVPVVINGMTRYQDPVHNHDFWMTHE